MKARATTVRNQRNSSRRQRKQQHLLDVKVRSRAATRQRNRRLLAWLSSLLLFGGAVFGAWYGGREALRRFFWRNPDYNLAQVEIHTDGPLTREQILQAANIQEGKNIFTINLSAARKGLMALPQVDRAEVERILPDKISIDIAERKPVAWATGREDADPGSDPGAFLIDRGGVLMRAKTEAAEYFHLPVICGLAVENYEEGQVVDLPEVRAALELIRLTGENPARLQVRAIDVSKGYCMIVTDERRAKITFPLDDIAGQLDRLGLLLASVESGRREIQTVNLLVQRNVPVTFVPPPEPDPAEPEATPAPVTPEATKAAKAAKAEEGAPGDAERKSQFLSTRKNSVKRAAALHHAHAPTVRRAIPLAPFDSQPGAQPAAQP